MVLTRAAHRIAAEADSAAMGETDHIDSVLSNTDLLLRILQFKGLRSVAQLTLVSVVWREVCKALLADSVVLQLAEMFTAAERRRREAGNPGLLQSPIIWPEVDREYLDAARSSLEKVREARAHEHRLRAPLVPPVPNLDDKAHRVANVRSSRAFIYGASLRVDDGGATAREHRCHEMARRGTPLHTPSGELVLRSPSVGGPRVSLYCLDAHGEHHKWTSEPPHANSTPPAQRLLCLAELGRFPEEQAEYETWHDATPFASTSEVLAYDVLLFHTTFQNSGPGLFLPTPPSVTPDEITRLVCFSEDRSPVTLFGDLGTHDGEIYGPIRSLSGGDFGGQQMKGGREWHREERHAYRCFCEKCEQQRQYDDEDEDDEEEDPMPGEPGLGLEIWMDEGPWYGEEEEEEEEGVEG